VFGCRIHDQGNKRFAGSEDEDDEQDPWCDIGLPVLIVNMGMIGGVGMIVVMRASPEVPVTVAVRLFFDHPVQAPDKIGKTETDQQPGCGAAAERLYGFQPENRHTEGDTHKS